jgi:hypothetical protein
MLRRPSRPPSVPSVVRRVPTSDIAAFIRHDHIERILTPLIQDAGERALVLRCLLDVGPAHHRGTNYIFLRLLSLLLDRLGNRQLVQQTDAESLPVPMRLPPALGEPRQDTVFPLRLPMRVLLELAPADSRQLAAMVDCLTDGPPQHSLANAAMLWLLEAALCAPPPKQEGPHE